VPRSNYCRIITVMEILRIYAEKYMNLLALLGVIGDKLERAHDGSVWNDFLMLSALHTSLVQFQSLCEDGELPVCGVLVGNTLLAVNMVINDQTGAAKDLVKPQGISANIREMKTRLSDELSTKFLIQFPASRRSYFDEPLKGWEKVIDRFPEAVSDVEEMNKCFALSRYPAAVFHSTQIVESALIRLGQFLQIRDPKSGWTAACNELRRIVANTKYDQLSPGEKRHFSFLQQTHATAVTLNDAWRNKISHAQNKLVLMTKDFSPDVAEEILIASRGFVRRLADELPEGTINL